MAKPSAPAAPIAGTTQSPFGVPPTHPRWSRSAIRTAATCAARAERSSIGCIFLILLFLILLVLVLLLLFLLLLVILLLLPALPPVRMNPFSHPPPFSLAPAIRQARHKRIDIKTVRQPVLIDIRRMNIARRISRAVVVRRNKLHHK